MSVLAVQNNSQKDKEMNVGGQAVIEGVMMRSPKSYAVAVRKPDKTVILREQPWEPVWEKLKFMRKPFLRGTVTLVEAMWNGISALTFSANHAIDEEELEKEGTKKAKKEIEKIEDAKRKESEGKPVFTPLALTGTIIVSFLFSMLLFVVLPHLITFGVGQLIGHELTVDSFLFHLIDGIIKVAFLVAYVWLISMFKDIRRVFQYHGAEHKSIFAYEAGLDLTVENVRPFTTYHPRCGTSFLVIVLGSSIILFSMIFPFMPALEGMNKIARNLVYIAIKIPLMLPVAGISYELIKYSAKHAKNPFWKLLTLPGLWLQRITTKEPDDSQIEMAILSLKKCLWREENPQASCGLTISEYPDFAAAVADIDTPETATDKQESPALGGAAIAAS